MTKKPKQTNTSHFFSKRSYYDKATIKKSLSALEKGATWDVVCNKYGMSSGTLSKWVHKYGNPESTLKNRASLTLLQRRSIVSSIQQGLMTIEQAKATYGIKGHDTIQKWIRLFKEDNIDICGLKEEALKEQESISEPSSAEVKMLRKELEESQLKVAALNILIDTAQEQLKINIRKKSGAGQSQK
ncbi:hypothetical protein SAMN05216436_108138 [bacterium A37T11]|nr:hypothetical protein SAMN05216436_108138 [bacterium A37T11]